MGGGSAIRPRLCGKRCGGWERERRGYKTGITCARTGSGESANSGGGQNRDLSRFCRERTGSLARVAGERERAASQSRGKSTRGGTWTFKAAREFKRKSVSGEHRKPSKVIRKYKTGWGDELFLGPMPRKKIRERKSFGQVRAPTNPVKTSNITFQGD